MIFKKNKKRGFILPATLIFLAALGALATFFALQIGLEQQISSSLIKSDQEKLICLSALEHVRALMETAEISCPGSWLAAGMAGPYDFEGRNYRIKISPLTSNAAYQEFFDGTFWQNQTPVSLADPKDILSAKKRENKSKTHDERLNELALILSDACDENRAVNENAGQYGAEAVEFSEILSDDGSELRLAYRANAVYKERTVTSLPYFYGNRDYDSASPLSEDSPFQRELFDPSTARHVLRDECEKENGRIRIALSKDPVTDGKESAILKNWQRKKMRAFPVDGLWRNCRIAFFGLAVKGIPPRAVHNIIDSDGDSVYLRDEQGLFCAITNASYRFAQLRGWVHSETLYSEAPYQTLWLAAGDLQKDKYYCVQIQDANFPVPTADSAYGTVRNKKLIAGGDPLSLEETEANGYVTDYALLKPQKADSDGGIELILRSPSDCSPKCRVRINSVYFRRPDIVSVINRSDEPVFLSNWKLTAQTGEGAYLLGTLPSYAALPPGGRFYLSDQTEILREEYGFRELKHDRPEKEAAISLLGGSWGLDYEISSVKETKKGAQYYTVISCKNAFWEKDELMDEVAEIKDGLRFPIEGGNTRAALIFSNLRLERYAGLKEGDKLRIVGLPRHVEYASLTLKNEYSQVAAKTKGIKHPKDAKRYSSLLKENDVWRSNEMPFENFAPSGIRKYYDRPLTNDSEVFAALSRSVRHSEELKKLYSGSDALTLYAKDFPASAAGYKGDWQLSGGKAKKTEDGLAFSSSYWPKDFWRGQKLRVIEGELKDEVFAVTGSVRNIVLIGGASLPRRLRLENFTEGLAALGPGYRNIFFTAHKNNACGEWIFSNLWDCLEGELYAKGLSDAIDSGEFLEENHNALITPEIFDWEKNAWEKFPSFRFQKNDSAYLTTVKKRHLSASGCLKLKLTAKGLDDASGSGRAWFQGIAVCPKLRPAAVSEEPKVPKGPIPLTVYPNLLFNFPALKFYRLEVTVGSKIFRYILSIGQADPVTGRRKLNFQTLP